MKSTRRGWFATVVAALFGTQVKARSGSGRWKSTKDWTPIPPALSFSPNTGLWYSNLYVGSGSSFNVCNGTSLMIDVNGNVGLCTTNPSQQLRIVGGVHENE